MKTDEGWVIEILRMFLEHCTASFDKETADFLGEIFCAGLMTSPDLVEMMKNSPLYQPVGISPEEFTRKNPRNRPNPEIVLGKRWTMKIHRPV